jgi:tRNA(adenine34) deaminase
LETTHIKFMREALMEARKAFDRDEVPIGAIVVYRDKIIARAHNLTQTLCDATAHAELQAMQKATHCIGAKYLHECTLYVTIEPCPMCAAATYWSHVGVIVYGAPDAKRGYSVISPHVLHPKTQVIAGILAEESKILMQLFFRSRRNSKQ